MSGPSPTIREQGFTLIEIIVTFTVAAVMLAMVVPYMNSTQTSATSPTVRFQTTLATFKAMENITADYNLRMEAGGDTAAAAVASMNTAIGAVGTTQNNNYGTYKVVANGYIQFNVVDSTNRSEASASATTTNSALKVTVADPNNSGVQFTTLFTQY